MCSVPGVPIPGSEVSVIIKSVNINQSCGLVELCVNMNSETKHVYEHPHSPTTEASPKDEGSVLLPETESCVLGNVLSVQNTWPERAANFLKSLPGKEFEGLVQHVLMPHRAILLDVPAISKHLCKEGVLKKIPVDDFKNLVLKSLNLAEEDVEPMDQDIYASNQLDVSDRYFYLELLNDAFESVRVTEVIDPGNIFCELLIFSNAIKTLTEQLNEESKQTSVSEDPQPQTPGTPCAAKGSDGKWRRAVLKQQITSIDETVDVFFIDEGKRELVKATNIKKLDQKFLRTPVVTYHCSLEGVRKDKDWTRDEIDHLKTLLLNQNIVAQIERHISPRGSYSVSLYSANAACINQLFVDKEEVEMSDGTKQKFTHEFHFNVATQEAARPSILPNCSEQESFTQTYASPFSSMEMPLCEMLTVGASVGVKISCIDSPSKFWCQTSQCDKKLDVLMKDLQAHYASVHPKPLVESVCVARNPDNNLWYRAKILTNQLSPDIEVRFIDYGQTKKVPLCELRPIDPAFLRRDAQAFQCSLFDVPPTDANYAKEEFHKFVDSCSAQNGGLKCIIKAVAPDEEGILLNTVDLQTQSESAAQVLAEKLAARPETYNLPSHNIEVNSNEKISITFSETVHRFYGRLDKFSHLFQQVQSDIETLAANSVPSDCPLAANSLCIARYNDTIWCRGKVVETFPCLKVHFIDFGQTLALNKTEIRPFQREASAVKTVPMLAIPLGLFNIPEEVPQEINDWFTAKVVGNTLTMTVIEKGQNGKLIVELLDGSKSLNAQIREKIVSVQMENKQLCNGSKTNPVSDMEIDESQTEVAQQEVSQKLKIQDREDDLEDWIVVDNEPENDSIVKEPPEEIEQTSAMEIDAENKALPPNKITTSSDKFVYKKPVLFFNQTLELHASCISSPDFFWCQCSNNDLDKVTKLAQIEGNVKQDRFFHLTLLTGQPCLALYKTDNQWYRAQVINRNPTTFTVVFIDYGNEEDIDYKDVRPLPASLLEVAPQAFLCCLDEVEETEKRWKDDFIDKFYYTLEGKPLKIQVLRMRQNPEMKMPQYDVQIEDVGVHKLLQKYGISISGDALNRNLNEEVKTFHYSDPDMVVGKPLKGLVSSISSPGFFWCQYLETKELDRIAKRAQRLGCAEYPPLPDTLVPGSPCLALYSVAVEWCRAKVISREKDKIYVLFVDYGNDEEVDIVNVKPIPPRLMELRPQAFLCCLEDGTTWDDAHCKAFSRMFLGTIIKSEIVSMEHNEEVDVPQYTVRLDYDVKHFCGITVPKPATTIPQITINVQNASQNVLAQAQTVSLNPGKYNEPRLTMNESVKVYATSISTPEYFWCQYHDTAELDEIAKLAQSEGLNQQDPNFANNLSPGNPCLALFSEDNVWYRAQIRSKSQDKFSVLFIDYGNEADVCVQNVRPMSSRLLAALPQGFLCRLEGYDQTKGAWVDEGCDYFFNLLVDKVLTVTPSGQVQNQETKLPQFVVQIQCGNTPVNKDMSKYWKSSDQIEDISSKLAQNVSINVPSHFKKPNVTVNRTEEVYGTCIADPHYFWCQYANSDVLDGISKLAQDAGKLQRRPGTLDPGDICLALFSADALWYRGLVTKKTGETLTVTFIDYGNEAEVDVKDARLLPLNLLEQPPQAFLCSLHGFHRSEGTWEDRGCDDFFNFLVDKPLKVKIIATEENRELALPQYSVQIWCDGVDVNMMMEKFWRGAGGGSGGFQGH